MKDEFDFRLEELKLIEKYSKSKEAGVLTILFSDLIGYTNFSENHTEIEVQEFRREHDKLLVDIIEGSNKGKIIKFMGDACMAIFASPTDAVKIAKKAKIEMKKLIEAYRYQLDFRIGIHMGEVVVEEGVKKDVFGRHVNRAQRIESLASSGQIFLSFPVYDSVKSWLDEKEYRFFNHGYYRLKGIKEDAEIYELCLDGEKEKKPYWKLKVKKYKTSFYSLLLFYILTIVFYMMTKGSFDIEVVSGERGYVYVNGKLKGELEANLLGTFEDIKPFSKVTIEANGEETNFYPIVPNKDRRYELYREVKDIEKENLVRVEGGKNKFSQMKKDILVSKYEVTQENFLYVMNIGNYDEYGKILSTQKPINEVTWFEAVEYCNRVSIMEGLETYYEIGSSLDESGDEVYFVKRKFNKGYRLPSKEEWLFIASGGNLSKNYLYSGSDEQLEVAVIGDWSKLGIEREDVASKKANELGIYDMSGNVSEWTDDDYNKYQKIVMGTAWSDKYQEEIPLDKIKGLNALGRYYNVGFRLVRDI